MTFVEASTALVVTVNVAEVAPAATVRLGGVAATAVLLLDSETTAPFTGAGLLSVTVPVADVPPVTLVGFTVSEESAAAGGFTVSVAVCVLPE